MAKKSDPAAQAQGEASAPKERPAAAKLVPLEKRLRRLRKEEAKRQRQYASVQAKTARTAEEMAGVLAAVKTWVDQPATSATPAGESDQGRSGVRRLISR